MKELSIKIKICNRVYPMKVAPQEEKAIRNAGKMINEYVKNYTMQFGLEDKQDLLAMVALDCVVAMQAKNNQTNYVESTKITQEISSLTKNIDHFLQKKED